MLAHDSLLSRPVKFEGHCYSSGFDGSSERLSAVLTRTPSSPQRAPGTARPTPPGGGRGSRPGRRGQRVREHPRPDTTRRRSSRRPSTAPPRRRPGRPERLGLGENRRERASVAVREDDPTVGNHARVEAEVRHREQVRERFDTEGGRRVVGIQPLENGPQFRRADEPLARLEVAERSTVGRVGVLTTRWRRPSPRRPLRVRGRR